MSAATDFSLLLWANAAKTLRRSDAGPRLGASVGRFLDTDQTVIRVLEAGRAGPDAKTIVIVPDPPNVIEQYLPIIDSLSSDYRVVCFETPGFGCSHGKKGFSFDVSAYCRAYAQLFETLNIKDAVLDMACLGGFVGLAFAAARPDLVRHLLLQQTPALAQSKAWARRTDFHGFIRTPFLGQVFMRGMQDKVTSHWYKAALPAGREEMAAALAEPARAALSHGGCFCLCNAYQTLLREPEGPPLRPRRLTLIWGDADRTHAATDAAAIATHYPYAEFMLFTGSGHFPLLEAPERYLALLRAAADAEG